MRTGMKIAIGGCLLALSACGGQGDDSLGDNVADAAEARADDLDEAAENAAAKAEALETKADVVRDVGEAKEEAIDDADVNAAARTDARNESAVNGM